MFLFFLKWLTVSILTHPCPWCTRPVRTRKIRRLERTELIVGGLAIPTAEIAAAFRVLPRLPAHPHPVIYPWAPFYLLSFDLSTPQRDQNSTDRVQYARLILSIEPKHHHRHPRTHKEPPISIKHHNIICPNPNYKHSAADKPPTQHLLPTHHRNPNEHRRSSSPTCFLVSSNTTGGRQHDHLGSVVAGPLSRAGDLGAWVDESTKNSARCEKTRFRPGRKHESKIYLRIDRPNEEEEEEEEEAAASHSIGNTIHI